MYEIKEGVCVACGNHVRGESSRDYLVCERHALFVDREQRRLLRARQRSIKKGVPADLTIIEWMATLLFFHYKCAYCGSQYQTIDHIKPLAEKGKTCWGNCIPACLDCNLKKDHKNLTLVYREYEVSRLIHIAEFQLTIVKALQAQLH